MEIKKIKCLDSKVDRSSLKLLGLSVLDDTEMKTLMMDIELVQRANYWKRVYRRDLVNNPRVPKKEDGSLPDFYETDGRGEINYGDTLSPVAFYANQSVPS